VKLKFALFLSLLSVKGRKYENRGTIRARVVFSSKKLESIYHKNIFTHTFVSIDNNYLMSEVSN
jgi:hypothetical protein